MTTYQSVVSVRCKANGTETNLPVVSELTTYTCSLSGEWTPTFTPCAGKVK